MTDKPVDKLKNKKKIEDKKEIKEPSIDEDSIKAKDLFTDKDSSKDKDSTKDKISKGSTKDKDPQSKACAKQGKKPCAICGTSCKCQHCCDALMQCTKCSVCVPRANPFVPRKPTIKKKPVSSKECPICELKKNPKSCRKPETFKAKPKTEASCSTNKSSNCCYCGKKCCNCKKRKEALANTDGTKPKPSEKSKCEEKKCEDKKNEQKKTSEKKK